MENLTPYTLFKPGDRVNAVPAYSGFFGWLPLTITRVDGALVYVDKFSIPWPQDCFVKAHESEPHKGKRRQPSTNRLGGSLWLR